MVKSRVGKLLGEGGFGIVMSVRRIDTVFAAKIGKMTTPHLALLWLLLLSQPHTQTSFGDYDALNVLKSKSFVMRMESKDCRLLLYR